MSSSKNAAKRRLVDVSGVVSASANPKLSKPFEPLLTMLENVLVVHVRAKRVAHAMYTLEALLFARAMYAGAWYDIWEDTLVRYSRFPFEEIVDCVALACAGNDDGLRDKILKLFRAAMPPLVKWLHDRGKAAGIDAK